MLDLITRFVRPAFHYRYSSVFGVGVFFVGISATIGGQYSAALICLAIGGAWLAGWWIVQHPITARRKTDRHRQQVRTRWWGAGFFVAVTIALSFYSVSLREQDQLQKLAGTLFPANEPDPKHSCPTGDDEVTLYIGDSGITAHHFPLTVLAVADKPAIVIDRDADGTMALSVDIRSQDGKIIASIDKNKFTVNPNNSLSMKRPDRSSLLVVDQYGSTALNAHYVNRHSFQLTGRLNMDGRFVDLQQHLLSFRNACINSGTLTTGKVINIE
jgi:hypothetical protein